MTTGRIPNRTRAADLELVDALLDRLGLLPENGRRGDNRRPQPAPTFDEYVEQVSAAATAGTRRVYGTYWKRIRDAWGSRRLDDVTALEIRAFVEKMKGHLVVRRNARDGRTAAEHLISAFRSIYRHAVDDGIIAAADNPATRVAKPTRLASTRRALSADQLAAICQVAATTGNDPDLDGLLLRLHIETACRRAGTLALRRSDVDLDQCLLRLTEKGQTVRWQPVSPTTVDLLVRHYEHRGNGDPNGHLLRYRNGHPLTRRRYDHLWTRVGKHLQWVHTQQISTHWLRHTTLTWVERHFGYAIARAYAGHNGKNDAGTTSTYVRADVYEVARALAKLSGQLHPLA